MIRDLVLRDRVGGGAAAGDVLEGVGAEIAQGGVAPMETLPERVRSVGVRFLR